MADLFTLSITEPDPLSVISSSNDKGRVLTPRPSFLSLLSRAELSSSLPRVFFETPSGDTISRSYTHARAAYIRHRREKKSGTRGTTYKMEYSDNSSAQTPMLMPAEVKRAETFISVQLRQTSRSSLCTIEALKSVRKLYSPNHVLKMAAAEAISASY
ncbi:hypothetical protein EJ110_NYTH58857 [Nymphaea thermarum]|nr:hypothetical protein EJ110_NYTH58857 [Nymphaea thermarum]